MSNENERRSRDIQLYADELRRLIELRRLASNGSSESLRRLARKALDDHRSIIAKEMLNQSTRAIMMAGINPDLLLCDPRHDADN